MMNRIVSGAINNVLKNLKLARDEADDIANLMADFQGLDCMEWDARVNIINHMIDSINGEVSR